MLSSLVSLLIVIIDHSAGDQNLCQEGAGNTKWRCAKVTISGVVSYHWTCCNPNAVRYNCAHYDLGEMRADIDLSLDEITVNKNTIFNDDWDSCDSNTLCKMTFSVKHYELVKGCNKPLHDKEHGDNHYKSAAILRRKKVFKPFTKQETLKLREAYGKKIGSVADYATESGVKSLKNAAIYLAKQNDENTYNAYNAYNDDELQSLQSSETNSFILFGVSLVFCALLICFCLICLIGGGLTGFIAARYYSQSNYHKDENAQIV